MELTLVFTRSLLWACFCVANVVNDSIKGGNKFGYKWDILYKLSRKYPSLKLSPPDSEYPAIINPTRPDEYVLPAHYIFKHRLFPEELIIRTSLKLLNEEGTLLALVDPDNSLRFKIEFFRNENQQIKELGFYANDMKHGENTKQSLYEKIALPFESRNWEVTIFINNQVATVYTKCEDIQSISGYHQIANVPFIANEPFFRKGAKLHFFGDGSVKESILKTKIARLQFGKGRNWLRKSVCSDSELSEEDGSGWHNFVNFSLPYGNILMEEKALETDFTTFTPSSIERKYESRTTVDGITTTSPESKITTANNKDIVSNGEFLRSKAKLDLRSTNDERDNPEESSKKYSLTEVETVVNHIIKRKYPQINKQGSCNCKGQPGPPGPPGIGANDLRRFGYGSLVFSRYEDLALNSFHLPEGTMSYVKKEDRFYLKTDESKNLWKALVLSKLPDENVEMPVPTTNNVQTSSSRPITVDPNNKLVLVALPQTVKGNMRFNLADVHTGDSSATYSCQKQGSISNLRPFYAMINSYSFIIERLVPETYRFNTPIVNMKGEKLFSSYMNMIYGREPISNNILDFNQKSIMRDALSPCIWIGNKSTFIPSTNSRYNNDCKDWTSMKNTDRGLVATLKNITLKKNSPFTNEEENLKALPCSKSCYVLCIQIYPAT